MAYDPHEHSNSFSRVPDLMGHAGHAAVETTQTVATGMVHAPLTLKKRIVKFTKTLGPGLITGASDDDPSGIATYSQTGATFGYSQLWLAVFTFPLMTAVQEMCARIGLVTGEGLAGNIRKHYSRKVLFFAVFLLFIANTVNVGADLGAMADATRLLAPQIPFFVLLLVFSIVSMGLAIFLPYRIYAKVLKYLTFALFAYVISAFMISTDWSKVLMQTFVPSLSFSHEFIMNIVAILGTTISPYLYFWQTSEIVEEQIQSGLVTLKSRQGTTLKKLELMRTDVAAGMFFSNIVMWFIIATTAGTLNANGIFSVDSAPQAAEALRPFAGDNAYLLFAFGIIGTGMLAIPILAGSAAYALAEAMKWREGLNLRFTQAKAFYTTIIVSFTFGFALNFTGVDPLKMLYYTAILNGIIAPPLLFLIIRLCNNKEVMGSRVNGRISNTLGWLTFAVMSISALLLLVSSLI